MKVSLNWVKEFTKVELSVDELVEKIGAQLGAVEEVVDLGKKYQGIIIAKVVECAKHPDADKLNVCKIDDGGVHKSVERDAQGLVQVVCGAPNVRQGMLVAWLPPGATVPSTYDKDPFVLEAREIRSKVSNGMLASAAELAISEDHNGIVEIDQQAVPGDDFAAIYALDDYIIDIENKMFTHRPDCFGMLGVAREIAGIQGLPFKSPAMYKEPKTTGKITEGGLPLTVKNELPELVPRFMAVTFEGVQMGSAPLWMQTVLSRLGVRPINNVVDITNYFMLLTGQPLHAYDYAKVKALSDGEASLVVRHPQPGEKIKLLNGKEIEPRPEAIMIATDKNLIGIGGVMGGADTEVDAQTTDIILEAASFDLYSIRKTAMEHGLFTDAVTRFSKGQSPHQNDRVVAWATDELIHDTGAQQGGTIHDLKDGLLMPAKVETSPEFINARLGSSLTADSISRLLENVEFEVDANGESLTVTPPFWRTDIEIPEDIVEEVGRLHGYDQLPVTLPQRSVAPVSRNPLTDFKTKVRDRLSGLGAHELLTYSFVPGELFARAGQDAERAFQLANALSPELQYYRLSLTPSLLDKVHPNVKAGSEEFALFEINKVHAKGMEDKEGLPGEFNRIALTYAADPKAAAGNHAGAPYYQARLYAEQLLAAFGKLEDVSFRPLKEVNYKEHFLIEQMTKPYDPERSAALIYKENVVGVVGEYVGHVRRAFKLPAFCAGFETFHSFLLDGTPASYTPLSRYPIVEQDISLRVSTDRTYEEVFSVVRESLPAPEQTTWELTPIDIYQKDDAKHITLRLRIASYEKTMTAAEVNKLLDDAAAAAHQKLGAERL